MVTYTREKLALLIKKRKISIAVIISVAAVCVAACTISCFFLNRGNAVAVEIANCVLTAVCGWFVIGFLFLYVFPCGAQIEHVKTLLAAPSARAEGEVTACSSRVTVSRYLEATEVTVRGEDTRTFYWDDSLGICPFSVGDRVVFNISRNFISSYEVNNEVG